MSKLEDLRKLSEAKRIEKENTYREAVGQAIHRVLNSDDGGLIVLNAMSQKGASLFKDPTETEKFVKTMAEEVARSITNPIDNFLLLCKTRGLTDRHVRVAVSKIYESYFKEFSTSDNKDADEVAYDKKLEAVATKLELNQNLWDELSILQKYEGPMS